VGQQIAIAQAEEDECAANEWLRSRSDLLCLPRFTSEARPAPRALGNDHSPDQVIFLAASVDAVIEHWVPVEQAWWRDEPPGEPEYHLCPKDVACVEWTRTTRTDDGRVMAGRYYLHTGSRSILPEEQQRQLRRLMSSLAAWIRKSYPSRSAARNPIFVGPALATQLNGGARRLVHANGVTPVELGG